MTGLLVLLLLAPQAAAAPEARFAEANARYDAGDYTGAHAAYLSIEKDGFASPGLYLNLADAYYRLDSLGQAVRYLERARQMAPDDPRVAHNLRIIRSRLNLTEAVAPPPYWHAALSWLHRRASPMWIFSVGLLLFFGCLGILGWRAWTGTPSAWTRRLLLVLMPPALLLVGLAFALSMDVGLVPRGVVLAPADIAPGQTLPEGTLVRVHASSGGRLEVETPRGDRGWIEADRVGMI